METEEINNREPISLGDWLLTLIVTAIPFVGFIMLFVWSFSKSTHPSKSNWAKASLILIPLFLIGSAILLYIIFFTIFGSNILGLMENEMIKTDY